MDSKLYEELCRRFIAREFGVPLAGVTSPRIPNPERPDLPEYSHQIDLCWELATNVALYLHIANAKWRASKKVDQPDVMLLQQVRQKVGAHKALLITSTGFTGGAVAAARDEGIGLHIVRPEFDYASFPTSDRVAMQSALEVVTGDLYSHEVIHRATGGSAGRPSPALPSTRPGAGFVTRESRGYSTRQATGLVSRARPGGGGTGRSLGGSSAPPGQGPSTRGGGGGSERR